METGENQFLPSLAPVKNGFIVSKGTIVLIHGMWMTGRATWVNFVGRFRAEGYSVAVIELPGVKRCNSIDEYVQYVQSFLDNNALGDLHLVGHSMGGLIAQLIASRDSRVKSRIKSLVLISPATPRGIMLRGKIWRRAIKYLPQILRGKPFLPNQDDLRELVVNAFPKIMQDDMLMKFVPESGRAARDILLMQHGIPKGSIKCPIFILTGREDKLLPFQMHVELAKKLSARLQIIEGRGHMMVVEKNSEGVRDAILGWIGWTQVQAV